MPLVDEATLKSKLKERSFYNSYLIFGDEPYLKQYYADLIAKKCVTEGMEGFNLRKFDVENGNDIQELIDSTDTLPAFSEYTCTVIKNFPLDSMYSSEKERFENWLKDMPETTVAIFWQDTTEINQKKNTKWKSVISLFEKYGCAVCLDKMDKSSLAKTVAGGLKKRGKEIDRETAYYLIDTVGNDLNMLLNEVEKLADYKREGTVTVADINAICIKSLESNVYDLSKSLFAKKLEKSLGILNKLFADKEKPEIILGVLAGNFIDIYRAKVSVLAGESSDFLKEAYAYKGKEFRLKNAARDASRLDISKIRKCLELLCEADRQIKLRISDEKIILEKLIIELYMTIN